MRVPVVHLENAAGLDLDLDLDPDPDPGKGSDALGPGSDFSGDCLLVQRALLCLCAGIS